MECFTDSKGEKWQLELTVGSAMKVRAECDGLNLVDAINIDKEDNSILDKLSTDAFLLVAVLYALCETQARERKLSPEDFASRFTAETIQDAGDALVRELINFSQPAKRKILNLIYSRVKRTREKAEEEMDKLVNDPKTAEDIDSQLSRLLGNTQESSE